MVFLVERYKGHFFCRATLKQLLANPLMLSSVLYMESATPPSPLKLYTSKVCGSPPFSGVKVMVSLPFPLITVSVARYWSPKACLPTIIGALQFVTSLGTFLITMGSLNTVPSRILRMVPLGLFHIC